MSVTPLVGVGDVVPSVLNESVLDEPTPSEPTPSEPATRPQPLRVSQLSDGELLAEQAVLAARRRRIDARSAEVAAEIARRSSREFGNDGLAVRHGARSAEDLIQRITGGTGREARSFVKVGELMGDAGEPALAESPWLGAVCDAVASGALGVEAAAAIQAGVGGPSAEVSVDDLAGVVDQLVHDAATTGADRLAARARQERDLLDAAGVGDRERARRDRRFLKLIPQWDGMTKLIGLLDPESAALVTDAFDRVTSPRRHGPRFASPDEQQRAERIIGDPRTTPQLMQDAFVEMVSVAAKADGGEIFGRRAPAVRVHVAERDLAEHSGSGSLEGQVDAISIATVERHACNAGIVPVAFDSDGQVVDVGRTQRLHTTRQRIGMAARDGGCRSPGCDRPPAWCEAHHIVPWSEGGKTSVADGVLLCRFHHQLMHTGGWRIRRQGAEYFAVPPAGHPDPRPLPMPTKGRRLVS